MSEKSFYTVRDLCDLWQSSPSHIRKLIVAGHLKAHVLNPGGQKLRYRIPQEAVDAFLRGSSTSNTATKNKLAEVPKRFS